MLNRELCRLFFLPTNSHLYISPNFILAWLSPTFSECCVGINYWRLGTSRRTKTALRMPSLSIYRILRGAINLQERVEKRGGERIAHCAVGSER